MSTTNGGTTGALGFPRYSWPYVRQALVDVMNGADYPREYDTWIEVNQRNYENARIKCVAILTAGLIYPLEFNKPKHQSEFVALAAQAERILGGPPSGVRTRTNDRVHQLAQKSLGTGRPTAQDMGL